MAAPILWTHGKKASVLQEKPVSIKFLVLGGGYFGFGGGRGSADFIFIGRGDFLIQGSARSSMSIPDPPALVTPRQSGESL